MSAPKKSTRNATLASIVPGLGQIYMGETRRGGVFLFVGILLLLSSFLTGGFVQKISVLAFGVVWLYSIYDARIISKTIIENVS